MPFVSPGVYVREFDYSQYVPLLASSIFGCLGYATRGPVNHPVLITNPTDLINTFGTPNLTLPDSGNGIYAALQYLTWGNQLLFVRVADGSETTAQVVINDGASPTPHPVMTITANTPGTWGSAVVVTVSNGSSAGYYNILVQAPIDLNGTLAQVEYFQNLSLDPTSPYYIETVLANGISGHTSKSSYIRCTSTTVVYSPVLGSSTLAGGTNGILTPTTADYIGTVVGQQSTGLQVFANAEYIDVNMIACPGQSDPAIVAAMNTVCSTRHDCMYIVDPPFGLDVTGVEDYHNVGSAGFNSSFGALYWPWIQIYDPYNKQTVWLPPSGFIAAQYAYTDYSAYPWFAPAGFTRGALLNALKIETSPDQGQRDSLYSGGNAVNPIVNFQYNGITIWGQRTLQRMPSALDRVNVRRGMLYIEKIIATAVKYLVFEPNDPITWKRLTNLVTPALDWMKSNRGLYQYGVICDATTNTNFLINNNTMDAKIWVQPTKAAEIIMLDFVILATGASFSDSVVTGS